MRRFVEAVRDSYRAGNWYASLSLALALPDICGKMRSPIDGSQARYIAWANDYLTPWWTHKIGRERIVQFLGGRELYLLRCAFLHAGTADVSAADIHDFIQAFQLVMPEVAGNVRHMNWSEGRLQLQVDQFCEEICVGVERWLVDVDTFYNDGTIKKRMEDLMHIEIVE